MLPVWISFLLGFIVYYFQAILSNSIALKQNTYYIYIAISTGIAANYIWFSMAQNIKDNSKILLYGLYWDILILVAFLSVPILFYGARFKTTTVLGIVMIIVGFLLTKLD